MVRTTAIREDVSVQLDAFPAVVNGRIVVGLTVRLLQFGSCCSAPACGFCHSSCKSRWSGPCVQLGPSSEGIWQVNGNPVSLSSAQRRRWLLSTEAEGDVYGLVGGMLRQGQLQKGTPSALEEVDCAVGQATACELYRVNLSPGDRLKRTAYVIRDEGISELLLSFSATRLFSGVQADFKGLASGRKRDGAAGSWGYFWQCANHLLAHCDTDQVASSLPIDSALAIREAVPVLAASNRLGLVGEWLKTSKPCFENKSERGHGDTVKAALGPPVRSSGPCWIM